MKVKKLKTPLGTKDIENLVSSDMVNLSGTIIGARDQAHKRIIAGLEANKNIPIKLNDEIIFYLGPSPAPPHKTSGSIGPTTSARMDNLTEPMLKAGVAALIGKGKRADSIKTLLKKYKSVYFICPGGIAAYLSTKVKKIKTIAYQDLGPEALYELEVKDFPLIVAYDVHGGDIFSP